MRPPQSFALHRLPTPIGTMLVVSDREGRVRALDWHDFEPRMQRLLRLHYGDVQLVEQSAPAPIREPLDAYFGGQLDALALLRVETAGTAFQRQVWSALRDIPAGSTETYGALAARIGRVRGARPVGLANGANPVSVIVPCHRVIGSSGVLTGYAGGLARKRWLLTHEGVTLREPRAGALHEDARGA